MAKDMHKIISLPYGYFEACCYLIQLPNSICLIDPAVKPAVMPLDLTAVRWIIATHGHIDHISHADDLRRATGAPLYIHSSEADCLMLPDRNLSLFMQRSSSQQPAERLLSDGDILMLTDGYCLEIIHTPGHTAGCICLLLKSEQNPLALFTGDTLFAGSIGRLDLGGSQAEMTGSLRRLAELLPRLKIDDLPIYPGHGPESGLGYELDHNPYFRSISTELAGY